MYVDLKKKKTLLKCSQTENKPKVLNTTSRKRDGVEERERKKQLASEKENCCTELNTT